MTRLQDFADQIAQMAPAGFYVALHVGFSFPSEELNRLPERWVDFYTRNGLVMHDPMMRWVYANTGATCVDALELPDPQGVIENAALHGLKHGAIASALHPGDHGRRSYGFFFRADRHYAPAEVEAIGSLMSALHTGTRQDQALTAAEIEALKLQASGMRLRQIALTLGISESAVKARLNNAKRKLGAKTPSQAASIAASRRLL